MTVIDGQSATSAEDMARLSQAHARLARDHAELAELIDELAAKPDLHDLIRVAIARIASFEGICRVCVGFFNRGEQVGFVVLEGEPGQLKNLIFDVARCERVQQACAKRAPLVTTAAESVEILQQMGLLSELGASLADKTLLISPLVRKQEVVGLIMMWVDPGEDTMEARLLPLGRLLTSAMAVALGNALAHDLLLDAQRELRRRHEKTEKQLDSLRKFSDIFELSLDGILLTDLAGAVLYANTSAGAILQRKPAKLQGQSFFELLGARSQAVTRRAYRGDAVGDAYGYLDLLVPDEFGSETVISAAIRPLGENEGVLVSFRDVTELREIETELRQTKEFLENVIQSSVDAIIAADTEGRIILFNRAAEQILGFTAREAVGRINVEALYPPGEARDVMRRLRSEAYGGPGRLEMVRKDLVSKSGELVPVNLTAAVIYEEQDESAVVGIFTDLRERMKMEAKLTQAQQKLRVSERQAVAIELAGAAAHELNQPLTSIMGYADLLKRRVFSDDPMVGKAMQIIARETERMASIVRKLGEITSYQTKPYVGRSQILDLGQPAAGSPHASSSQSSTQTSNQTSSQSQDQIQGQSPGHGSNQTPQKAPGDPSEASRGPVSSDGVSHRAPGGTSHRVKIESGTLTSGSKSGFRISSSSTQETSGNTEPDSDDNSSNGQSGSGPNRSGP